MGTCILLQLLRVMQTCCIAARQHAGLRRILLERLTRLLLGLQVKDLSETTEKSDADAVIVATPMDLNKLIHIKKPSTTVKYAPQQYKQSRPA